MKKIIALLIATVMVFALAFSASAAGTEMANSPSSHGAPEVISAVDEDEVDRSKIDFELIPYGERGKLDGHAINVFENSYKTLVNTNVLEGLGDNFQSFISQKGIKIGDLAVSDFFFTHYTDGECIKSDKTLTIKLDDECFPRFLALMHYVEETGKWEVIPDTMLDDKGYLTFTTDNLGSFAVIMDKLALTRGKQTSGEGATDSPKTSDNGVLVYLFATVLFAGAVAVSAKELKRTNG